VGLPDFRSALKEELTVGEQCPLTQILVSVSEHMGWVCNVALMNVYFGSGKPQGVGISGGEGPDGQMGEVHGSVYEQPKEEVDGSCHSKEGSK
jgi:hypothetical protein